MSFKQDGSRVGKLQVLSLPQAYTSPQQIPGDRYIRYNREVIEDHFNSLNPWVPLLRK